MTVTKDEIHYWKQHPVTREFLQKLLEARDKFEDIFALKFDDNDTHEAALFRGRSQGIQDALEWPDRMIAEMSGTEDEEYVDSTATSGL